MSGLPFASVSAPPSHRFLAAKRRRRAATGPIVVAVNGASCKKHVLITGGNTGIGKSTATELASQGMAVTLACRNKEKGEKAAAEISHLTNNSSVRAMVCDLASLQSVRRFVEEYKATDRPLHVLVNNAGIMACPQSYTEDGFEQQFGVNHLGHFLLTGLLLDTLERSASAGFMSRIVTLASAAEVFGKLDFDDLNFTGSRAYQPWLAYGQSKLANVLFAFELGRRCKSKGIPITSNCLHPGVVATELARHVLPQKSKTSFIPSFAEILLKLFRGRTPAEGAATVVYLATSASVEGCSMGYYEDCQKKTASAKARDVRLASKLWSKSEDLTKSADMWQLLKLSNQYSV